MQNADLKSQLTLLKRTKSSGKPTADSLLNHELTVKMGKKFAVMVFPWPTAALFMDHPNKDSPDPDSSERFVDGNNFEAGLMKELHAFLDDRVLSERAASYAPFRKSVRTH